MSVLPVVKYVAVLVTYRYRIKNNEGTLNRWSRAVNFVWNYCNDRQREAVKWGRKWLTGFDLNYLTIGSSAELSLQSGSINAVCEQYVKSRKQRNRPHLRYRGKRSLGWVPFKGRDIKYSGDTFTFYSTTFRVWFSRPIPEGATIKDGGSFSQDAKGNWYINLVLDVPVKCLPAADRAIGIDLGLKDLATLSTGEKVENPRHFRTLEAKLATAQRARKKRQARNIHTKIANARRDFLHKLSTSIVRGFDYIAVGNVNAKGLARTSMAKSVHDAGWSSLRTMLRYKSIANGRVYAEVDESFTTQVCSECGCLGGPKGIAHLGIRQWICGECGASHDRDVNSARNILARSGHRAPVEGIAA